MCSVLPVKHVSQHFEPGWGQTVKDSDKAWMRETSGAVAIDMHSAYELKVREHCPSARIVYDLFHVLAKYRREVIERAADLVRLNELLAANKALATVCVQRLPRGHLGPLPMAVSHQPH